MILRTVFRRWALLALLLVAACGGTPTSPARQGGPALWRVQRGDLDGYLFGTVHVLPDRTAWRTPALEEAIDASDRLVLEIGNLADRDAVVGAFERLGRAPDLPPVADRITPEARRALDKLSADGTASADALAPYKDWAAAMLLSAAIQQKMGVSESNGVEPLLTARFRDAGKPLEGLETLDQQFGAFDALPSATQRRMLEETILDAGRMPALMDEIVKAWLRGDLAAIARADTGRRRPDPLVEQGVIAARNRAWTAKIDRMRGRPFIAVGTAHLAGDYSLVAMLEARGFTVRRIQ